MGTFGKSAHNRVLKNGTSGARIKILRPLFLSPTSPKNDGISFGFKCLPLLDGFLIHSEIWYFFGLFQAVLPLARTPSQKGGAINEI